MENTKKDILWRLYLTFAGIVLLCLAIIAQIVNVSFVHGETYRAMADSVRTKQVSIPPARGSIYSDKHEVLATSFPYFNIYMDPCAASEVDFRRDVDSLSIALAHLFKDKPASAYKQKITTARKQGKKYLEIHKRVTLPQKQLMQTFPLFRIGQNGGGFIVEPYEKREYPYGSLAVRTIGYVRNGRGIGLEGAYDTLLSGKPGMAVMRKVAGGSWIRLSEQNEIDPVDGVDIITTLDINMQDITETALRNALVKNNAKWGTAVVMEVKTGKIKAISNLSRESEGVYHEDYNYAILEKVEPGSTWKLFSLMCLFEDGLSINDHVDLNFGQYPFADRMMKDSEPHGRRDVTVKTAFALSSNVGISRLAWDMYQKDPETYVKHLQESGIVNVTGVELPGEPKPYFKQDPSDKNHWYKTTVPWMSVGYELLITPLQLATFYNAVANDGVMMKPYLVEETQQHGKTLQKFEPVVLNEKLCSSKTIDQLHQCLLAVVDSGTAKHLKNDYYKFAGKTGTAQLLENGVYGHNYLSSFAGYFPYENPKYTIVIIINSPSNGVFYGGAVAAPAFREIADKVYSHFVNMREPVNAPSAANTGVQAFSKGYAYDYRQIFKTLKVNEDFNDNEEWIAVSANGNNSEHTELKTYQYTMPDVRGMGLRDAMYLLDTYGLTVAVSGAGKVTIQSIPPGTAIQKDNYVMLTLE